MRKQMQKLLSLTLILSMCVSMFSFQASATQSVPADNTQQIEAVGGSNPAGGSLNADGVAVSKVISPTSKENYFDIDLNVTTTQEIQKIYTDPDVEVVLVMDISHTMKNKIANGSTTRYDAAMNAAQGFISEFASKSIGTKATRKIGFVAFNTDAHKIFGLKDCKTAAQADALNDILNSDESESVRDLIGYGQYCFGGSYCTSGSDDSQKCAYNASHSRFTNIEAGLQCAYDMLKNSNTKNKYIIFLSDGFPTTYLNNDTSDKYDGYDPYMDDNNPYTASKSIGDDGYFYNQEKGALCKSGTSYSDKGAERAQRVASTIKAKAQVYSIGVGMGTQTVGAYEAVGSYKIGDVVDRYTSANKSSMAASGSDFVIGDKASDFEEWLRNDIGSGFYANGENSTELVGIFDEILKKIESNSVSTAIASWVAADPMPFDPANIEFLHFYTKEGAVKSGNLTGKGKENTASQPYKYENTAEYKSSTDSIDWDVTQSGFTVGKIGDKTSYTYHLKYKVRLKNELDGFIPSTAVVTNAPTELSYYVRVDGNLSDEKEMSFPIPQVEGYLGELTFNKTDPNGTPLEGAKFVLTHKTEKGDKCSVCGGAVDIDDMTEASDSTGTVSFTDIPSGHQYTLTETKAPDGYKVSSGSWDVEVAYGTTTVAGYLDGLTVVNTPKSGEATLEATKTLTGRDLEDGQFEFELKDEAGAVLQTKTNDEDGKITFDPIEYPLSDVGKTFTYTISEVNDGQPGYTYDGDVETVTVTVKLEDTDVKTDVTYANGTAAFENSYTANGSIELAVDKVLTGRDLEDGQFSFELKDSAGTVLQTKANDANGGVTFDAISFDQDDVGKTFTYTISEVVPADKAPGYTYDEQSVKATVTVADNGNGTLTPEAQYTRDGQFTNSYAASGEIQLTGTKVLKHQSDATKLTAGEFTFTVKEGNSVVATGTNGADGVITFTKIEYDQDDVGEHTYVITEDKGVKDYIIYDETAQTVKVTVTDNGDGTLAASAVYDANGAVFTNTYTAKGSITLGAKKTLANADLAAGQYKFVLKEGDTVLAEATNAADGTVTFAPINYVLNGEKNDIGTHTYTISEVAGSIGGVTYDTHVKTVTVTVADAGSGILSAVTDYKNDEVFANVYNATGSVTFSAMKELSGRDLAAGQFSFELKDAAGAVLQTKTNDATGSVAFDEIEYQLADLGGLSEKTFTYTISEVIPAPEAPGYAYDDHAVTVTVTVKHVGGGEIQAVPSYEGSTVFANTYTASGSAEITAVKRLIGTDLKAKQFTFELYDSQDNLIDTQKNASNGSISFKAIDYTQEDAGKTFTYKIKEVAGDAKGYTYDTHEEIVTVTVVDNGDGTLTAEPVYENADGAVFTNTYSADGSIILNARKVLRGATLKDGQFSFELKDDTGAVLQTKTNAKNGSITFDSIKYSVKDAGKTFTYTINEVIPQYRDGHYTYDKHVETVEVTVTDRGNGELSVVASYDKDGAVFTNRYEDDDDPVTVSRTVKKIWKDDNNAAGVRPTSISVSLYMNGEHYADATLSESNGWSKTWEGLPAGKVWSVEENDVPEGYQSKVSGMTITNTYTEGPKPVYTGVSVSKVWNDNNDAAGKRPDSITVQLLKDGQPYDTITLSASNGWSYDWSELDAAFQWSVKEIGTAEGYTASVSGSDGAYTITNSYKQPPQKPVENEERENLEDLGEDDIPLEGADAPVTGDASMLWAAAAAASGLGLAGMMFLPKKHKEEEEN